MAAMLNVSENGRNNAKKPSVVILDSDEEEEQTTGELFQGFIKAVQPFLERKEILLLRVKFAEIRSDYASCPTFREMLRRKASQVHNSDVYIHFNDVLKNLISNAALYGRNALKRNRDSEVKTVGQSISDAVTHSNIDERSNRVAGKFETDQQGSCQVTSRGEPSNSNQSNPHVDVQIVDLDDQPSSQEFEPQKQPTQKCLSKEDQLVIIRKQSRKKKIMKLERKLEYISNEIKRLTQSELSLEEMELADSNYIKESRLKDQFNKIWEKICMLKGRPPDTGRVVEQEIKFKGTNFPAIDRAVKKFLKKRKGFPNIFDIRNIVVRANKKNGLGLTQSVVHEIAADVFTDIGNKIQKKRKRDYEYNFGCHLTDDCLSSLDPALNDNDLRKKLDENKKVGQSALDGIFQKYVHLDRIKTQDNDDSTPCNSDYDSGDNEMYVRKKRNSSDSSGSEERKMKRPKHRERQTSTMTCTENDNTKIIGPHSKSLVSPTSSSSRPCVASSKPDSIEIIDDEDEEEMTVINNQQSVTKDIDHTSINDSLIQLNSKLSIKPTSPAIIDGLKASVSLSNGENNISTNAAKLQNGIRELANSEKLPKDSGNLVKHSNLHLNYMHTLSNHALNNQKMEAGTSTDGNDKSIIKNFRNAHEDQEKPQSHKEDLLMKKPTKSRECMNTMINRNCTSTCKVKVNASKLHLKIQQLRDKKLSDFSKTSEGQKSSTDCDIFKSRHHKRKSIAPHQIQEHLNGSQSLGVQSGKDQLPVDVPSVSQQHLISSSTVMAPHPTISTKQPLIDSSNCNKTQLLHASISLPITNLSCKNRTHSASLEVFPPVNDTNRYSTTNTEDRRHLSGSSLHQKGSIDTGAESRNTTSQHTQVMTGNETLTSKCPGLSSNNFKVKPPLNQANLIIILSDDEDETLDKQ